MRRKLPARRVGLLLALAALAVAEPARARPELAGRAKMGGPAKMGGAAPMGGKAGMAGHGGMFGQPLFQPGMAAGTLTVKVIRGDLAAVAVDQLVVLQRETAQAGAWQRVAEARTDQAGRATFAGKLAAGGRYRALVSETKGKTPVASLAFAAPKEGGVRLLLSTKPAPGPSPAPAASTGAPTSAPVEGKASSGAAEVERAADLPDGAVAIRVGKKGAGPVAGAKVTVHAAGQTLTATTDARGEATLTLPGKARELSATVEHDELSYGSDRVARPKSGGVRLRFSVYERTSDRGLLRLGPGTHLIARVAEGRVGFRQVLTLVNTSKHQLFDPGKGLELPLPAGAVGLELSPRDKRFIEVDQRRGRLLLTGPVPPGQLTLQYAYDLPHQGPSLDFRQRTPVAAVRRVLVVIGGEAIRGHGPALAGSKLEKMGGAAARVFELRQSPAGGAVELTLEGLPSHDRRASGAALILAALLLLWGALASIGGDRPTRRRRAALLDELVALERRRRAGELEGQPADYQRQRERLLAALRQLGLPPTTDDGGAGA